MGQGLETAIADFISYGKGAGGGSKRKLAEKILAAVQTPGYDFSQITPEMLSLVGEYYPEAYDAIIMREAPQITEPAAGRVAQLGALGSLERYQSGSLPIQSRLQAEEIQRALGQQAYANTQYGMEALASRGQLGGGQEAVMRGMANQSAMEQARASGNALTNATIQAQLQATGMGGDLAGQLRGQDIQTAMANQDAMSRFNQWASQLKSDAARYNAAQSQAGAWQTTGERQRISDVNAQNRQSTATENLERTNRLKGATFQDAMQKAMAQSNQLMGASTQQMGANAQQAQLLNSAGSGLNEFGKMIKEYLSQVGMGAFGG